MQKPQIVYLAINPKTYNWCVSKSKHMAWSTDPSNLIFDTGTILTSGVDKALEYCKQNDLLLEYS